MVCLMSSVSDSEMAAGVYRVSSVSEGVDGWLRTFYGYELDVNRLNRSSPVQGPRVRSVPCVEHM